MGVIFEHDVYKLSLGDSKNMAFGPTFWLEHHAHVTAAP